MSIVTSFTFNAFQENTFVVHDPDSGDAVIVDPGCHNKSEEEELRGFIERENLNVQKVLNTHCHVDHVFGNRFACETFGVGLHIHRGEQPVLDTYVQVAAMYGLPARPSPKPSGYLEEGDVITFGQVRWKILYTPGHSPASVAFYCQEEDYVIAGDVLFKGSIGRTDLPGGDFNTLIRSITTNLLSLPEHTLVYPGHGPTTTIGEEKSANPFLTQLKLE